MDLPHLGQSLPRRQVGQRAQEAHLSLLQRSLARL